MISKAKVIQRVCEFLLYDSNKNQRKLLNKIIIMLKLIILTGVFLAVFFLQAEKERPPCALQAFARDLSRGDIKIMEEDKVLVRVQKRIHKSLNETPQKIPRVIYQTNQRDQIPFNMAYCVDSAQTYNHDYDYVFYNASERRNFLFEHMAPQVLVAYDKLTAKAYQADIFRYSLIYIMGGCYVDIGFIFANSMREVVRPEDEFVSSVDSVYLNPTANPAFFCASPRHPILKNCIYFALENVLNSDYGSDSIDLTGPRRMGLAFKRYYEDIYGIKNISIRPKTYSGNVRILNRVLEGYYDCMVSYIVDPLTNIIIVYNKYPKYYLDMLWYTKTPYYGDLHDKGMLYRQSLVMARYKDKQYLLHPEL